MRMVGAETPVLLVPTPDAVVPQAVEVSKRDEAGSAG